MRSWNVVGVILAAALFIAAAWSGGPRSRDARERRNER
jgi:hypothetical protein